MMRHSLFALIVLTLTGLVAAQDAAPTARQPNVIFIVADDLGYADLGCQDQSKDVKTPNIDSIASSGVRFTNAYVSGPVCSPTRAGLLTGRYQQRFGFEQNPQQRAQDVFGLPVEEVTLPQQLRKAGYVTGMVGKWHLGHRDGTQPLQRGFDEYFGFWGGAHRYVKNDAPQVKDTNAIRRGAEPVGEPEYLTDAFTREAVSFIERHRSKPFFLYLPYNAVHSPMQAPPKYQSRFAEVADPKRKAMLAMLSAMDDGVGAVLAKLREAGLEENTLVVFFSDNGGPTRGNGSLNTPLRGVKGETLEGGVRVPFVMQWKGRLPAGAVEERPIIQLDLFPTALAAGGAALPGDRPIDGKNLLPHLAGGAEANAKPNAEPVHEALYWRFGPRRAIRAGNWKLHWTGDEAPALYDLSKDIGEATDLAAANPKVVDELMATWRKWDAQLMKPRWPGRLEGPSSTEDEDEPGRPAAPAAPVAP